MIFLHISSKYFLNHRNIRGLVFVAKKMKMMFFRLNVSIIIYHIVGPQPPNAKARATDKIAVTLIFP